MSPSLPRNPEVRARSLPAAIRIKEPGEPDDYLHDFRVLAGDLTPAGKDTGPNSRTTVAMASFSVVSNIASQNVQANLYSTQTGLQKALTSLSSGLRINMSGDDAAGLAVANAYRSDVAVINQGIRNANDGLSTLKIKDGALNNVATLLDRLATLATQSASGSTTDAIRTTLQQEATAVVAETRFNILQQSGIAALTQANQTSESVQSLLR
jgi:flagellin-like hook-associated protein FlgL